jgi:hypothetical protein
VVTPEDITHDRFSPSSHACPLLVELPLLDAKLALFVQYKFRFAVVACLVFVLMYRTLLRICDCPALVQQPLVTRLRAKKETNLYNYACNHPWRATECF